MQVKPPPKHVQRDHVPANYASILSVHRNSDIVESDETQMFSDRTAAEDEPV